MKTAKWSFATLILILGLQSRYFGLWVKQKDR